MKKVLIIDDSEVNLFLIKSIFEGDMEVEIVLESNSKHALADIREGMPDLIVLDLMMPHVDGFEILKELKTDTSIYHIPVLVVSAKHDRKSVKKVLSYGAMDYIKKPINLADVESKIRKYLFGETATL